jgi:uncharacterized membrane protein
MILFRKIAFNFILFLNILLVFLSIFEDKVEVPVFLQVSGRLHPAVVHFPLVLLFIVIFFEWLGFGKKNHQTVNPEIIDYLLYFFALSAALGALFGFFLFLEGGYQEDEINLHRWTGTAISLLSVLILVLRTRSAGFYYATLALTVVCVIITGHVGSEVTHGQGFVTEPIRRQQQRIEIEHPDSAIVFRDVIQPILNEKCVSCHSAGKAKNDLILTDYKNIMNGGEQPGAIVASDAEKSLIYKYIMLPMSDTLHMPPEGKMQLDREEIKLIGWWINTGGSEHEQYLHLKKVDSIQSIMVTKFQPKKGLDLVDIPFADPSRIKSLTNPYRNVSQISAVKPYVAVFLGGKKDFTFNDLAELNSISKQIVSIDLGNSAVSDSDMKALSDFPHLQKLHLQNISIGDEGLQHLRNLRYLEVLNLSGTNITGKALDEISGWKNLKKLYVYNTSIEYPSIESLRKSNPELRVFNTQLDLTDSLYYAKLTMPVVKIDSQFFRGQAIVDVKPSRGKVNYYYTLDGSAPTSQSSHYTEPLKVSQTATLKIISTMEGWVDSEVGIHQLVKVGKTPKIIQLATKPDQKLSAKSDSVLIDGNPGSLDRNDKAYLVFVSHNFDANLELKTAELSQVALSFLQDIDQGVFPPADIEFWGGMERNKMVSLGKISEIAGESKADEKGLIIINFSPREIRFLRVKAKNIGVLPSNHPLAKKAKPMLYIDEVAIN